MAYSRPSYGLYTAYERPIDGPYTASIWPTYGLYMAHIRPIYGHDLKPLPSYGLYTAYILARFIKQKYYPIIAVIGLSVVP